MVTASDLQPFCDSISSNLSRPWTRGGYTYATNGHVMVRVPALADVDDNPDAPDAAAIFEKYFKADDPTILDWSRVPTPKTQEINCPDCDGTGFEHECPRCDCACEECDGTGVVTNGKINWVQVRGIQFSSKYLLMLRRLPGLKMCSPGAPEEAQGFVFDG